jgi:hypothetical protein
MISAVRRRCICKTEVSDQKKLTSWIKLLMTSIRQIIRCIKSSGFLESDYIITDWIIKIERREDHRCMTSWIQVKKSEVFPVSKWLSTSPWSCRGSGCIAKQFFPFALDGVWSSSCLIPLYLWGNSQQYPLDRRLGGPQSRSCTLWRQENSR